MLMWHYISRFLCTLDLRKDLPWSYGRTYHACFINMGRNEMMRVQSGVVGLFLIWLKLPWVCCTVDLSPVTIRWCVSSHEYPSLRAHQSEQLDIMAK